VNPLRDTLALDGEWQIAFDPSNQGREARWHDPQVVPELPGARAIQVPCCGEEVEQDYEGVAYYQRHVAIPGDWADRRLHLEFDAVNYIADVWLNGAPVGRHEGGYGPFRLLLPRDAVVFGGDNDLRVRVLSPIVAQNKTIDGLGQNDAPHWRGAITGGIWQSVRLIATGDACVDRVFVLPHLQDDTAEVRAVIHYLGEAAASVKVKVAVDGAGSREEEAVLSNGPNAFTWQLPIPEARYWCMQDPHLHTVRVEVAGQDETSVRFGMRELTIRNDRFELNGEAVTIKAAFFEGLYPTRLALPDSEDMARRELQLAREAGFNMIRPWRKPPPPSWLDLCDEMGLMVVGGLPIECMQRWPTVTPELPWRVENEVRSAVLRDRNRACVVQWELFNELWREELVALKEPMAMLTRELDPTRLILDESGGFSGGANIYLPGKTEPDKFNDVHCYPGAPFGDRTFDHFLTLARTPDELRAMGFDPEEVQHDHVSPGLLTVVSEIGYGSLPDLPDNNARFAETGNPRVPPYRYHAMLERSYREVLKQNGLDAIYPDLETFCAEQQRLHGAANYRMIEAIRSNPRTRGYAVHALTDGDWVLGAGLIDLFRNPKTVYGATQAANRPRLLSLRARPRNLYAGQDLRLELVGINELTPVEGRVALSVLDATDREVWSDAFECTWPSGVSEMFEQSVPMPAVSGSYRACARFEDLAGEVVAERVWEVDLFGEDRLARPQAKPAVLDPGGCLTAFLDERSIGYLPFSGELDVTVPVLVTLPENTEQPHPVFQELQTFVENGGTAVYLELFKRAKDSPYWNAERAPRTLMPVAGAVQPALGLWVGVSHIVTDHPVFEGLPVNRMMGQVYENVWSPHCLVGTGASLIAAAVSHNFHQHDTQNQHFMGPEEAWAGMEVGVVNHGEGRYVLSALRLIENLGKDPVADCILYNLLRWVTRPGSTG